MLMKLMKTKLRKIKKKNDTFSGKVNISAGKTVYILVAVFIIFALLVSNFELSANMVDVKEGDICPENIIAPRRIVDAKMTEALKVQAENSTAAVYDTISSAYTAAKDQAERFFNAMESLDATTLSSNVADTMNSIYSLELTVSDYEYIANLGDSEFNSLYTNTMGYVESAFSKELKAENFDTEKAEILNEIAGSELPETYVRLINAVVGAVLRPNMILNEAATQLAKTNARDSVYEVVYEAGQTIINRGEVITEHHIQLLTANGLLRTGGIFSSAAVAVGRPVFLILVTFLFLLFVYTYHGDRFKDTRNWFMLFSMGILMLILFKVASLLSVYLIPAAAFAMCMSMLFGTGFALEINIFASCIAAVALQLDIDGMIYLMTASFAALVYMKGFSSRTDIFKIAFKVSIINIVCVIAIDIMRSDITVSTTADVVYALLGGILSSFVTTALIGIFQLVFNVATPFKLMELSSPGFPLMQRLISKAQGTYHHCLIVSNMSEKAAEEIGANALLARVGGYYHDIGKSENPEYFSENQIASKNPHDLLAPEVSANIIKNHVTEGLMLADKFRLPKEVKEFIDTHHGTSEISYFKYKAAKEGYSGDEDFRYNGDVPRTKECTIVMLADSVEAAVKSLDAQSEKNITDMIEKIVDKKMAEGQFEGSMLSFAELQTVKRSFLEVLSGVYHSRVKYPQQGE
ncbi:MAG: HDIG domain-containing protein [Anaerofustis stercorihominis]|nr:HDIG domain-containing protein [Anaerofustis stercorihominis]